jgi:hypothetical protein
LIKEEIKRRLNSGNACYHSVQNLLSYRLLSKNVKIRIYKTIILPVVLYGCETWSLTLREEHRLRIFGPKEVKVTGEWERLIISIIRISKSRRMMWAGHVARMEGKRNACRLLVEKPEGKKPLGRPRCSWVDNIRMDLGKVGWGNVDWMGLVQDRNRWRALVNSVLNLRVP